MKYNIQLIDLNFPIIKYGWHEFKKDGKWVDTDVFYFTHPSYTYFPTFYDFFYEIKFGFGRGIKSLYDDIKSDEGLSIIARSDIEKWIDVDEI